MRDLEVIIIALVILAAVVTVVTVVGHLQWIFFAWVFRGFKRRPRPEPPPGIRPPGEASAATRIAEKARFREQLGMLRDADLIDGPTYRRLMDALKVLHEGPARAATPPRVPPPPPAPELSDLEPVPLEEPVLEAVEETVETVASAPEKQVIDRSEERLDWQALPPDLPGAERKPMWQMFEAFLEQKNIRWGELIGGLLIVGCSAALVLSLWNTIASIPVLKFFIFTAVTAALFGVGFYTGHKWKLPTTSAGMLITATILIPLNFLAIAAFSTATETMNSAAVIGGEALATIVFAALAYFGGKVIASPWPLLLTIGVVGNSVSQLLVRRFAAEDISTTALYTLAAVPLGIYFLALAPAVVFSRRWSAWDGLRTNAMFVTVGITSFATLTSIGLLFFRIGPLAAGLARLPVIIMLLGLPALVTGLEIWRGLRTMPLVPQRVAGTTIAITGALVSLAGLLVAWPVPGVLLIGCVLMTLVLVAAAEAHRVPQALLPAGLCLTLGSLIGFHLIGGRLEWAEGSTETTLAALGSGWSGATLTGIAAILGLACAGLVRVSRRDQAAWLGIAAAVVVAASLAIVSWRGFGPQPQDFGAFYIYAIHATAALAWSWRQRSRVLAWIGSPLLLAALTQGLIFTFDAHLGLSHPFMMALGAHATLSIIISIGSRSPDSRKALQVLSIVTAAGVISVTLSQLSIDRCAELWPYALWTTILWGALTWTLSSRILSGLAIGGLIMSILIAVTAGCAANEWFEVLPDPLTHPWTLQAQTIGVVSMLGVLLGIRAVLARYSTAADASSIPARTHHSLTTPGLWLEGLVTSAATLVLLVLATVHVEPGITEEFATSAEASDRVFRNDFHLRAGDTGSWGLWLLLLIVWLGQLRQHFDRPRVAALILTGGIGCCLLLAGRWTGATASALRWSLALYWILVSAGVWWTKDRVRGGRVTARITATVMVAAPLILLTLVPLMRALGGYTILGPEPSTIFAHMGFQASSLIPLLLLSAGMIGHSLRDRLVTQAFLAGGVINIAVTLGALFSILERGERIGTPELFELLHINAMATALYSLGFLSVFLVRPRWMKPYPHRAGALAALILAALGTLPALLADAIGEPFSATSEWSAWLAVAAIALLMLTSHRDLEMMFATPGLWISGLLAVAMWLDFHDFSPRMLGWSTMAALSLYGVFTAAIWRFLHTVEKPPGWLLAGNSVLNVISVMLALWAIMTFRVASHDGALSWRLGASGAVLLSAACMGLFSTSSRGDPVRLACLLLVAIGALFFGWAWLDPDIEAVFVYRSVVAMVAMTAMFGLYSLGATRLRGPLEPWGKAALSLTPWLVGAGSISLVLTLTAEIVQMVGVGSVTLASWAIIVVLLALIAAIVLLLRLALVPESDPLKLSDKGRMAYVYAAEAVAVGLFMHVRFTMPWLFHGFFQQYWPLVIIAIAFAGVILSELFRRKDLLVLASPLEKTGALLPLLPVLAFWFRDADWTWTSSRVPYPLLLVSVGLLYGVLSVARKSYGFGMLAALAVNGGLWYLLHHTSGTGFTEHPQLWLIPLALTALAASYLNRHALTEAQMVTTRYICLSLVYISSTTDMFINGVRDSMWLPMVLMGLSVLGVLLGIWLRIRSCVFLGSGFLLMSLIAIIWSASAQLEVTWLWYIAGIVLGAGILALFAIFEKKREEVRKLVEELKKWEG